MSFISGLVLFPGSVPPAVTIILCTAHNKTCRSSWPLYCVSRQWPHVFYSNTYVNSTQSFSREARCLLFSGAHVLIDGDTDLGYVEDGTACGTDRVCFNHKCLPIQQFNFSTCPGTTDKTVCSGHGVHTHIQWTHTQIHAHANTVILAFWCIDLVLP